MDADSVKSLYLRSTEIGLKHRSSGGKIFLHAFCVMSNHSHQILKYTEGMSNLSTFMRIAHGEFGRMFNKRFNRSGKVANERPKTVLVQSTDGSQMRAHMYVEANPIRARMRKFENLKLYRFSSFRYYAFGIVDEFTQLLTPPDWYIRLGATSWERQKKYRKLFQEYLRSGMSLAKDYLIRFFGELSWSLRKREELRNIIRAARAGPIPEITFIK